MRKHDNVHHVTSGAKVEDEELIICITFDYM